MNFSPPSFHLFSYVHILCSAPCHQTFSINYVVYLIKLDQIMLQTVLKRKKKSANIHPDDDRLWIETYTNIRCDIII